MGPKWFLAIYKRLEKGKFQWPDEDSPHTLTIGRRELNWLLDGLSIEQKNAHQKVTAKVGHREEQLEDLPVEVIEYRLPEEKQVCPCCGGELDDTGFGTVVTADI